MAFLAQSRFRPDSQAIADHSHPDHQFRIDRGPARLAIEWPQLLWDAVQIHEMIHHPQQVVLGNMIFQAEAVKTEPSASPSDHPSCACLLTTTPVNQDRAITARPTFQHYPPLAVVPSLTASSREFVQFLGECIFHSVQRHHLHSACIPRYQKRCRYRKTGLTTCSKGRQSSRGRGC